MAVWLVRAGKYGENEQAALVNGVVTIGWRELPDLTQLTDTDALTSLYRTTCPNAAAGRVANHVRQLWAFRERIQINDLVVLPLKTRAAIAIGRVLGPYQFVAENEPGLRHIRRVEWLRTDIPRTAFDQDILHSFGAFLTVCQIQRNDAERRIRAVLTPASATTAAVVDDLEDGKTFDLEQAAEDQILDHIQRHFAGHELAALVDAVLRAEGYVTRVSPPGPDGGVDILAGAGPMGFATPRLCVQVKSSASPVDVNTLRELQGVLRNFHAEQGLLISWGGFKSSVIQEARQNFFTIRLWDSGDLLAMILKNHDKFPDNLKARLPLKRVWALVLED